MTSRIVKSLIRSFVGEFFLAIVVSFLFAGLVWFMGEVVGI